MATTKSRKSTSTRKQNARLVEKCARARALMEQAQGIIEEVLEDPSYQPDALPPGVVPSGVGDYLDYAIGMLEQESEPENVPA